MATTANTPPLGKTPSAAPGKSPSRPVTLAHEYTTGAELQTLREAAGLNRDALAELVGVQARTVKHWENGRAGVPADVADVAHTLARWVRMAADRMHTDTRHWLRQFEPVQVHHISEPEPRTLTAKPAYPLVLVRYQHTADMPPAEQEKGARADCHGAAVTQVVQRLALDGLASRVVWFDPASFASWRQDSQADDTPAARQAWAEHEAMPTQAIPPRGDQPPADFAPGYEPANAPTTRTRSRP